MRSKRVAGLALSLGAALVAGCGGGDDANEITTEPGSAAVTETGIEGVDPCELLDEGQIAERLGEEVEPGAVSTLGVDQCAWQSGSGEEAPRIDVTLYPPEIYDEIVEAEGALQDPRPARRFDEDATLIDSTVRGDGFNSGGRTVLVRLDDGTLAVAWSTGTETPKGRPDPRGLEELAREAFAGL